MTNSASDNPDYTGPDNLNDIPFRGMMLEGALHGDYAGVLLWEDVPPHQYVARVYKRSTGEVMWFGRFTDWDEGGEAMLNEMERYGYVRGAT